MNDFFSIEDIVKAKQKLEGMCLFEEKRKDGSITEAVLICSPSVKHTLKKALYENNIKDIPILAVPYAEEDKLYMVTDKDFIDNVRKSLSWMKAGDE